MTPRILLVDDDPVFRSQFARYLGAEFFSVAVAEQGEAALALLDRVEPDIVILDVRMPLRDGLEVCRAIRQCPGYAIGRKGIILISAHRKEVVDKVAGLEIGADAYLVKPFEPRELLVQIKSLSPSRLTRRARRLSSCRSRTRSAPTMNRGLKTATA